ncbi:flagellar basal body-associated protein FliL [Xenorhabdus nematophila]|uniref:Flagellar protein FliL n=1 Tax=Xenorhabdus nematophila (strain ATCC 19061 / DSM 3370 / CCUG 14189 / LMG 1036 / NCIMB 9965 / AN6) TaxID=406817 RepID=D3VC96_XENNA|nr:flagellar basal body-associated protein FliL [Xenorhabdus nematophila]CEF32190.1 flagellar biosynthesis [Xenorhabdus nematophila str. Websteri]AYA40600.1 flagellar basal body-associated protein FliL [Xenorhabdus nematophila]KHD29247.1 flagellar basal body-associated protein FliL [Xenorhabdus nematophila]MBA0019339.1 flagellar basal body-associated protein FliL [Xenorhabdus nematophila]MCB4424173.1 flagellar basal body-associated protein FliL [Xenorhabdus nematophila]
MSDYSYEHKRTNPIWIILLVLIAVIGAAIGGYSWWAMNQSANNSTATSKLIETPVFMNLEPFTVNLIDNEDHFDRVLYVGVTLRLSEEKTRQRFHDYLPEVRSRMLLLLSRQKAADLAKDDGKMNLVAEIKQTLSPTLIPGEPDQAITDVLFTTFILR